MTMKHGSEHYKAAQRLAAAADYTGAAAEVAKARLTFAESSVDNYEHSDRYVFFHGQLMKQLADLHTALEDGNADQTAKLFEQTSQTCDDCHNRNKTKK